MFRIEIDPGSKEHVLVADDGERLAIRDDVWQRLSDPSGIFAEWKLLLQKWSIHTDKAPLLKRECPDDHAYRALRTLVRTFQE